MKPRFKIFISPVFITALIALLANDIFLKPLLHNTLTGKISDFAGLFIFPLFWSVFFFRIRKLIYFFTIVFFIFWKSQFSQPFIDLFNSLFVYNISRTVDITDLIALISLPFSYLLLNRFFSKSLSSKLEYNENHSALFFKKTLIIITVVISFISFCATSYVKNIELNKTYGFGFNEKILLEKINNIKNTCNNLPMSTNIQNADSVIYNGKDTSYISFNGYNEFFDTIYKYDKVRKRKTDIIDTIYHYKHPKIDTVFIKNNHQIKFNLSAQKYFSNIGKEYCDCVECYISLSWKNDSSFIKLNYIYTSNCFGIFNKIKKKEEEKLLLEAFEQELITKLKS